MGLVLSYSLYSAIVLSLLYLTYKWMMAGEKYFRFNRAALWSIYGFSLLALPATKLLSSLAAQAPSATIPQVEIGEMVMTVIEDATDHGMTAFFTILLYIYMAGVVLTAIHTLWILFRLVRLISSAETVEDGRFYKVLVTSDSSVAPFSWWHYIVMSRSDWEECGDMICTHERQHLAMHHWIDLLVAQLVSIFQWYNPASWLMREELKTIHEYQADGAVIDAGVALRDYQMLLIKKAVGARFPSLANSLNHSKLKKRITMMYKSNPSASRRLRALALVPALAAAVALANTGAIASVLTGISDAEISAPENSAGKITQNAPESQTSATLAPQSEGITVVAYGSVPVKTAAVGTEATAVEAPVSAAEPATPSIEKTDEDNQIFSAVEQKPEFPGGDAAMLKYIGLHVKYPKEALEKGIEGRVVVQFVIRKDCSIGDVRIVRSIDPQLDAEAIRLIKTLPHFSSPGRLNGEPVNVWYTIPVSFKLDSGKSTTVIKQGDLADEYKISDNGLYVNKDGDRFKCIVNGEQYTGSLKDINPDDIKSITVNKTDGEAIIYIELKSNIR